MYQAEDREMGNGVVVLSGDRHIGAVYKAEGVQSEAASVPYPFWEVRSPRSF